MCGDSKWSFWVIAHSSSSNSLGRSLSLAMVAEGIGATEVLAFDSRGPLWRGAAQFNSELNILDRRNWRAELSARFRAVESVGGTNVVWLSKGLEPLPKVAKFVARKYPQAVIILDLDDDDAGLAESFAASSVANRARLHPLRRGNASRIRRAQRRILILADGFSFATKTLKQSYPWIAANSVIIPHTRKPIASGVLRTRTATGRLRVGAFGTLRPHKGANVLRDLAMKESGVELWTFADSGLGVSDPSRHSWVEVPPDTKLDEAYAQVDVALIVMSGTDAATERQLPAKLIDAMRSGVALVATPTEAINEVAHGCFVAVHPDSQASEILEAMETAVDAGLGKDALERFRRELTPTVLSRRMAEYLRTLPRASDTSGPRLG